MAPFCWGSWGEGVHQVPVLYNPVDQGIRKINWEDRVGDLFLGTSIRKRFSTSIEVSMWDPGRVVAWTFSLGAQVWRLA